MIWWDHYAWRKNRKYVKGRLLLGKMNTKLLNKNSWYPKPPTTCSPLVDQLELKPWHWYK
jgi:hypothetical protein